MFINPRNQSQILGIVCQMCEILTFMKHSSLNFRSKATLQLKAAKNQHYKYYKYSVKDIEHYGERDGVLRHTRGQPDGDRSGNKKSVQKVGAEIPSRQKSRRSRKSE